MALRLLGVPWDQTSPGLKGARLAPEAVRRELSTLFPYDPVGGRAAAFLRGRDLTLGEELRDLLQEVARAVDQEERRDPDAPLLLLGGDQGVTYAALSHLHRRFPELAVISLDGSLDLEDPSGSLDARNWLARAVKDLPVTATVLGLGRFLGSEETFRRARELGVSWVPSVTLRELRDPLALPELRALLEPGPDLYLSVDVSVLEAPSAPGCANPNPDGLPPRELGAVLEFLLTLPRIRGLDLCEVNPARDPLGTTARNAAWLLSLVISRLGDPPAGEPP